MPLSQNDDLDPRLTPAREDMAASWLKDRIQAPKYVDPVRHHITGNIVSVYRSPESNQAIETQFLFGEPVDVLDVKNGWAWVQSQRDSYVGYVETMYLQRMQHDFEPTHRVSNIGAHIYPNPSIKTTPLTLLSYGSLIQIKSEKDGLCELATGGFIPASLITPVNFHADEIIAEAFRFLGTPYLWGGRSGQGLDCSALVQLVLQANNIPCPRDSDLQEKQVGRPIDRDDVQSGDLVFFRGHIGLMVDDSTLIHANDRAMAVSIDDLDEYVHWRSKSGKTPVKMFKRVG